MNEREGPFAQIRRRYWRRLSMGMAMFAATALLCALIASSPWRLAVMFVGGIATAGFFLAADIGARCPGCGWMLTMSYDPRSFNTTAPLRKICSHCKRNLTSPDW